MVTQTYETMTYKNRDSGDLAVDVFRPSAQSRRCAVLVLHGGGWRAGTKESIHERVAALASVGFTAIAVQYRLLDAAPWPAALDDAAAALDWVRDNAELLDIDPSRVVVQGHSAGGHIALMTGALEGTQRPAAIVAYYPPTSFYPASPPPIDGADTPVIKLDEQGRVPSWLLFPASATAVDLEAASPIDRVDRDFPATILLHGSADAAVDVRTSVALHQRLSGLGVPCDLHLYGKRDHEFDMAPSMASAAVAATSSFIERFVTHREERDAEARLFPFPPVEPLSA